MIDSAKITVQAGKGGDGLISFRREKFIPKGGPWGGDGGKGGNVIIKVDPHLNTLTSLKRQTVYKAQDGEGGMKNRKHGKNGKNIIVRVPPGTLVFNEDNILIHDLTKPNEEIIIAKGGSGGLGNWHFKSSVRQTPRIATPGKEGEKRILKLELKLIADIGLIGLPSSGKSTLLNVLTSTKAKTAEYHFTTLEPNLGVLKHSRINQEIVIADIPGLIEGASKGKGLGHDFLKHIERTRILIHLIDGVDAFHHGSKKLLENYNTIQNELRAWNPKLLEKPQIIVITKIDVTEVKNLMEQIRNIFKKKKINVMFISSLSREGLNNLIEETTKIFEKTERYKFKPSKERVPEIKKYTIENLKNRRIVFQNLGKLPDKDNKKH